MDPRTAINDLSKGIPIDNSPVFRRVIQTVCDLARQPLANLRILDLGSAHGQYSIELATRGAQVLGIEGRKAWLEQALRTKNDLSLRNVEFVRDDVRNLSKEKYGEFDIVLCLGILYHLDAPRIFDFLESVFDVCRDFAIVETHFALEPIVSHKWRGKYYWGFPSREHPAGATSQDKIKNLGASLDNEMSFWFTEASLCNVLRHVGFSSVYDCRNPMANLYIGSEKQFKIWENRVTLVAFKGLPIGLDAAAETDWPESLEEHFFRPDAVSFTPEFNKLHLSEDEP